MADELELFVKGDTDGEYTKYEQPSFLDSLPEEVRGSDHIKDIGDAGALASAYIEAKSTATPDIPESPDGYKIPDAPEGVVMDEKTTAEFKALAHELKLTPAQVETLAHFDINRAVVMRAADEKALKEEREATRKELDDEWGDKAEANHELVTKVLKTCISSVKAEDREAMEERLATKGYMDDPDMARLMLFFGSKISEDKLNFQQGALPGEVKRGIDGNPMLNYDDKK